MTAPSGSGPGVQRRLSGPVVLDASYVIGLVYEESAAVRLRPVIARGWLTSVTAGEVFYKLHERSGLDASDVRSTLDATGISTVDLPIAAAERFPALRTIDAARRAEQGRNGERAARLSLADLCVLGYAWSTGRPVLTGDRHWSTLAVHGLTVPVYDFRDPSTSL